MTIAAAYVTSEGVVLGADSTTTVVAPKARVAQLLNHAQKVFEVGENSRIGICTYGAGSIGKVSHRTLVARLADQIDLEKATVRDAVDCFLGVVTEEYKDGKDTGYVGYFLGGCNPHTHLPECYKISLDIGKTPEQEQVNIGENKFTGQPEFFERVFHGYDRSLPDRLFEELKVTGLSASDDELKSAFDAAFDKAVKPLEYAGFPDLPIREAIDFVHTYLHITIKAFKFKYGAPVCGGPIEIAFISTDRKFRWVCHKDFQGAIYEQEV